MSEQRPICILIAALGGEGGGVLTDWLVTAAMAQDFPVQSTSIPGVAQRTGATTYYIEIFPTPRAQLNGKEPVLALYPGPGHIDIMIASELLEVGRALENGYVSPQRTVLIGSTHRIYSMAEKTAMSDQRYDDQSIRKAAKQLAKKPIMLDLAQVAESNNSAINAVLLGVIAGTGSLPVSQSVLEQAIRDSAIAVESNLRGFNAGLACASGELPVAEQTPLPHSQSVTETGVEPLLQQVQNDFPEQTHAIIGEGVKRIYDYQDQAYAEKYLERLQPVFELDHQSNRNSYLLTTETARYLALWMTYEDVIRVADLKTRPQRLQRVRTEVRAKADEPVLIHEFLKPGIDEVAAILPVRLGERLQRWGEKNNRKKRWNFSLRLKTHTISGFLQLSLLSRLRSWRPRSLRFQQEQALIERWLQAVQQSAANDDYALALEIVECANLNKGYGDTFERGRGNFLRIMEQLIEPALNNASASDASLIKQAREAALADPEGSKLNQFLRTPPRG